MRLLPCCLLLLSTTSSAGTVWLKNGDRLTGEILLLDGGTLAVQTPYAGRILVDWKNIDTLRSDKPLLLRRDGLASEHSQKLEAAGTGMVEVVNTTTDIVPLASIDRLLPPRPLLQDQLWEGNLDAKLDFDRDENKTNEWKAKGNTRMEHGHWRHVLAGQLEIKDKNDVRTKNTWELEYDLDRFLTDHWFWRNNIQRTTEKNPYYFRQSSIGIGPGYRFWETELGRLELISQFNRFILEDKTHELGFNTWSLGWDYKRLLWGTRLELFSTAQIQIPRIEEIDYALDSEFGR